MLRARANKQVKQWTYFIMAENVMLDEIWLAWKGLSLLLHAWANQISCIILETAFDVIMKKSIAS